jgi:hypothetical protein
MHNKYQLLSPTLVKRLKYELPETALRPRPVASWGCISVSVLVLWYFLGEVIDPDRSVVGKKVK